MSRMHLMIAFLVMAAAATFSAVADDGEMHSTKAGILRLKATNSGGSVVRLGERTVYESALGCYIRNAFRPDGSFGDEVFVLSESGADIVRYRIIEVAADKRLFVSEQFGNGESPEVSETDAGLKIRFSPYSRPSGLVQGETYLYEKHSLRKVRK